MSIYRRLFRWLLEENKIEMDEFSENQLMQLPPYLNLDKPKQKHFLNYSFDDNTSKIYRPFNFLPRPPWDAGTLSSRK